MKVSIGLPATIRGVDGETIVEWARRAESAGFSSVGVLDRLVAWNYDPLVVLAAVAAVTERVRLTTSVLLAPLHTNTALLAKQTATLNRLSDGRLTLGLGLGGRDDDYAASGLSTSGRGKRLDEQLEELKRIWAGEERGLAGPIGPPAPSRGAPELIVGGYVDQSFRRAAKYADGWSMGGGAPGQFAAMGAAFDNAWAAAGRQGRPRKLANAVFSLGPDAPENADRFMRDYFAFMGDRVELLVKSVAVNDELVQLYLESFEQAGCDELFLFPCSFDPDQVDLLAEAARVDDRKTATPGAQR